MTNLCRAWLLLTLLAGAACARGAANPPVTEPGAPPPTTAPAPAAGPERAERPSDGSGGEFEAGGKGVGVRRLGRWTQTGIERPERLVFRDERSLAEFWSRLGTGEPPKIDFDRELVVAAASGQQATGGHSITIGRAVLRDGVLVVEVVESSPGPDCMATQALSQPVDVVAIPAEGVKSWRFVERDEVGGCGGTG